VIGTIETYDDATWRLKARRAALAGEERERQAWLSTVYMRQLDGMSRRPAGFEDQIQEGERRGRNVRRCVNVVRFGGDFNAGSDGGGLEPKDERVIRRRAPRKKIYRKVLGRSSTPCLPAIETRDAREEGCCAVTSEAFVHQRPAGTSVAHARRRVTSPGSKDFFSDGAPALKERLRGDSSRRPKADVVGR